MRLTRWLGVALIVAGVCGPSEADIFVWRDNSGVSHYTNDLANVPPEYRDAAFPVAKDWARAQPAPEPAPVAATVAADPGAAPVRDGYEAAYVAGFRAGEQAEPPAEAIGSVVQDVEVQPQSGVVADRLIPVPVIVEHQRRRGSRREDDRNEEDVRDRFPPAQRAPYLQGPAGPPPVSER